MAKGGPKLGIDFTGGAQIVYGFSRTPDDEVPRGRSEAANVNVVSVQRFDRAEEPGSPARSLEKKEDSDLSEGSDGGSHEGALPPGRERHGIRPEPERRGHALLEADRRRSGEARDAAQRGPQGRVRARGAGARRGALGEGALPFGRRGRENSGRLTATGDWLKAKLLAGPFTLLSAERRAAGRKGPAREGHLGDPLLVGRDAPLHRVEVRYARAPFGSAAVVALIHDAFITLGAFSVPNLEISLTVVAALLTIVGFSINDTIVVFDRIRENARNRRRAPLPEVMNNSINETLTRTILTSVTVFLTVVVLFLFGGEVIHDFAFAMLVGIVVGTYSSIFIAAPIVIVWEGVEAEARITEGLGVASRAREGA